MPTFLQALLLFSPPRKCHFANLPLTFSQKPKAEYIDLSLRTQWFLLLRDLRHYYSKISGRILLLSPTRVGE